MSKFITADEARKMREEVINDFVNKQMKPYIDDINTFITKEIKKGNEEFKVSWQDAEKSIFKGLSKTLIDKIVEALQEAGYDTNYWTFYHHGTHQDQHNFKVSWRVVPKFHVENVVEHEKKFKPSWYEFWKKS